MDSRKEKPAPTASDARSEGEGNRTAARQYNEHTRSFVRSGRVDAKAEEAKKAREGSERGALDEAERIGKSRTAEEDPQIKR